MFPDTEVANYREVSMRLRIAALCAVAVFTATTASAKDITVRGVTSLGEPTAAGICTDIGTRLKLKRAANDPLAKDNAAGTLTCKFVDLATCRNLNGIYTGTYAGIPIRVPLVIGADGTTVNISIDGSNRIPNVYGTCSDGNLKDVRFSEGNIQGTFEQDNSGTMVISWSNGTKWTKSK